MAAVRPRRLLRRERPGLVEAGLDTRRELRRLERGARHVLEDDRPIGADHAEFAVGERDVRLGRLQQARRDLLALGDHLVGRHPQRGAADDRRSRSHRPHAEGDPVRVTVDVEDVLGVEAEPLVEDLLERGLVPLALVLRAHEDGRAAARREPDLGELRLGAGRLLDRVDDG